jgi:ribosomal protein L17
MYNNPNQNFLTRMKSHRMAILGDESSTLIEREAIAASHPRYHLLISFPTEGRDQRQAY